MTLHILGPRHLPCCGQQRVVLVETPDPQRRTCGVCRRRYTLHLRLVDEITERAGLDVYRIEYEEVVR